MKKKINRISILLCCLLTSCVLLCGCPPAGTYRTEESYSYYVHNINGGNPDISEDYYYSVGFGIAQFSFADQYATTCMRKYDIVSFIDAFAVSDEYIIFLVPPRPGKTRTDPDELWKYDRMTESFELLLEAEHDRFHEIAIYEDFIIYGAYWADNFYMCPIEGNPEIDSISLLSLLEQENMQEQNMQKGIYRVQEVYYQGLRVLFFRENDWEEYRVMGILDEGSEEVIWSAGFLDNNSDLIFWGEGEWIIFSKDPGSNFYYQREGEAERHRVQCLDDPKYENSGINPYCLTMAGERVVGLMSVHNNPRGLLPHYQADIENDILFEINLGTGNSRIIYETDNAQTRIIGYKNGQIYLLEDDVIYRSWIDKSEREKIYDFQEEGWLLYDAAGLHRDMHFRWQGDNLIIWGPEMRSIYVSD